MAKKSNVSDILNKKLLLIQGLEENIFKNFTSEEEDLLHSKHGRIKVWQDTEKVYDGITGAFKEGLPVIIDSNPVKTVSRINIIDWNSCMFQTVYGDWFHFEFTPIKLRELLDFKEQTKQKTNESISNKQV